MAVAADAPPARLDALPSTVLAVIADHLVHLAGGSPRGVIAVAAASATLWAQMGDPLLAPFWAAQCRRMGWSLAWLPPDRPAAAWPYFLARMRVRWRLRRQLRLYRSFLDGQSAQALHGPALSEDLSRLERTSFGVALPWEALELWRGADGQEGGPGVEFINGARLLTAAEAAAQARIELGAVGRAVLGEEFEEAVRRAWADVSGGGDDGPEPQALVPLTNEIRGRRQYVMDLRGRVWLRSGFNLRFLAGSLAVLLHRTLI